MVNYQQGKIYKIVNSVNNFIYIGSTCDSLSRRMANHRAHAKFRPGGALYPAMLELGFEKFRIILIEDYPCVSKSHLEAREFQVTSELKATGVVLYNLLVDGMHSEETRKKMSENRIIRGCMYFDSKRARWQFTWYENLKQLCKCFSVKKYGVEGARGLAFAFRDTIYPVEQEDDSEFIREIQAKCAI